MRQMGMMLLLALAACSPQEAPPPRVVEQRIFQGDAPRGQSLMKAAMLQGHNAARAEVGVAPLAWDDTLAADALAYARTLARSGRFEHSKGPRGAQPEGENLWTGTRGAYFYSDMVGHWVAEKSYFVNAPTPNFSNSGRWEDVAHYTQIIWRGTIRMGCAMASNATDDMLVCRYSPPGNVYGQAAF